MTESSQLGGNNPPPDQRLNMLTPAEDIPAIVAQDVKELSATIDGLLATVARAPEKIESDEVYDRVVALIAALRDSDNKREEKRKAVKDPYLKASQAVDAAFKLVESEAEAGDGKPKERSKLLDDAVKSLTSRLSAYDTAKFEREEAEARKEREALAADAAKDGITIDPDAVEVKMESRRSEHGGLANRSVVREWEVVDEAALPRSVLSIDPKKVQALVDQDAEIPGIKVTRRVETNVRRK